MMNVMAISLVVASMAVAGVWSPNPPAGGGGEQVIVKGGHRAVVVEYADDSGHGNTKVSISPPLTVPHKGTEDRLSSAKDAVAGVAKDATKAPMGAVGPDDESAWMGPGELICDAFGKCKHKISGAIYKAKNKTAEEVEEGANEVAGSIIDGTKETASKAKNGKAKRSASRAKEVVEDTAEELEHKGKVVIGKAGEAMGNAAEKAKRSASRAGEKVEEEISDIAKSGKEALHHVAAWLISRGVFGSLMGVVHLLGFTTAYGTATWVTFVMSHLLTKSLLRQQFSVVQSKVYPIYFKAMAASVGLALMGHLFGHRQPGVSNVARTLQSYYLDGLIAMVLANLFYLEPRATKVMYERMKLEKEEGRGVSIQTTRLADTPLSTTKTQRREEGGEEKSKMERLTRRLRTRTRLC